MAGLQVGDRIDSVDGVSMERASVRTLVGALKAAGKDIALVVTHDPSGLRQHHTSLKRQTQSLKIVCAGLCAELPDSVSKAFPQS